MCTQWMKRVVSVLLCMALVIGMIPISTLAAEWETTVPVSQTEGGGTSSVPEQKELVEPEEFYEPAKTFDSAAQVRLDSYEQFLAYYYLRFSSLSYYLENDEIPYHTFVNNKVDDFEETLATWKLATMDAGDVTSYTSKEVDFYILLIYDIIYQKTHKDNMLDNFDTSADALMLDTLAELTKGAGEGVAGLIPDADIDKDNVEEYVEKILASSFCESIAEFSDIIVKVANGMEYADKLSDLFEKLAMMKAFIACSEEIDLILADMHSSASDPLLKEALRKMRLMATGLLTETEIAMIFGGDLVMDEVCGFALEALWDTVTAGNAVWTGAAIGQKVGKLASGYLFGTDAIVEAWYSMEKVYTFEKVLKPLVESYKTRYEKNPTYENAVKFNRAVDMYLNTLSVGMEYAIEYVEAVQGGGILGWIYKNLLKRDYDGVINSMKIIKSSIDQSIELTNNVPYNFYLEEKEAEGQIKASDWEPTHCDTTEEQVNESVSKLSEINFQLTNQTVSEDTTYSEDKLTYANYTLTEGTLDLAGRKLTVYGDFYLDGGNVNVHGGTLEILGDLYVTAGDLNLNGGTVSVGGNAVFARTNSDGVYTSVKSSTKLVMANTVEEFTIGGSLVTYMYTTGGFKCSAGTMRIGGNWTNYNNSSSLTMSGSDTFSVIFTGTKDMEVYGNGALYVPNMTIENAASRKITMGGGVGAGTLNGGAMTIHAKDMPALKFDNTTADLTIQGDADFAAATKVGGDVFINGNATLSGVILDGRTMEINGDVLVQADLTVGNVAQEKFGTVRIHGDLQTVSGKVSANYGAIHVDGNAVFARIDSNGSYTKVQSGTTLLMANAVDEFTIGGSLVTYMYTIGGFKCSAGTMRIGGNWTNYNASSSVTMSGSDTFSVIFTGTKNMEVHGNGALYVPNMTIENAASRSITMRGGVGVGTLSGGAMTIQAKDMPVLKFDTTTADLTIQGDVDFAATTKVGGDIVINGNATLSGVILDGRTMEINGDVLVQADLTVGNVAQEKFGTVRIHGDLQDISGKVSTNYGAIHVEGNAIFARIDDNGAYTSGKSGIGIVMANAVDEFTIGGNLVTYMYTTGGFKCSAGTMRIGGNWTNYNASSSLTMSGSGTFSVIFTGTKDLLVYGNGALYVPNMTIENAANRSITMRGGVSAGTLSGENMRITARDNPVLNFDTTKCGLTIDGMVQLGVATKAGGQITVNGDLYSNGFAMGANTLTTNGDLYLTAANTLTLGPSGSLMVNGDVWMQKGTMSLAGNTTINGNLYQSGGDVAPNQGQVLIRGDYRIQKADESSGELVWGNSSGKLKMVNDADRVIVGGSFYMASTQDHNSFLKAGTLYICGDFEQISANIANFKANGTHRVMLCGTEPQRAVFASTSSKFNILQLTQDRSQYTFIPDPCWNTLEENVEMPDAVKCLNGHSWDDGAVTTIPGCETTGTMTYTCKGCGMTYQETLSAVGHNYEAHKTEPSCDAQGYTTYTCTGCGSSYTGDYVGALDHSYDAGQITVAPSCTAAGVKTYTCIRCGASRTEAVEALGHDHAAVVTKPDCLNQGFTTHTCTRCADSYTDSYTNALGHAWDEGIITIEPTEDEEGVRTHTCTRCGETKETTVPALGSAEHTHVYSAQVTHPSCAEQGYTTYTCACGDSYTADYVNALGHVWELVEIITESSCDELGTAKYVCTVCGLSDNRSIPAIDHDFEYEVIDPTCTEYGYILFTCEECYYAYRTEFEDPMGHFYQNGVCKRCKHLQEEEVASGICGDNLYWSLTAEPDSWEATLTISGTGNMWDFDEGMGDDPAPWGDLDLDLEITTLIVEPGCTSIGDYAFNYDECHDVELKTVVLADSITRIGMNAFEYNSDIDTIRLPANLKTIEEYAFSETGLLDVEIPDTVTYLRKYAFADCEDMTRAVLPEKLSTIEESLFRNCPELVDVTIPETVTKIGTFAFYNTALMKLVIPDSVTRIEKCAFYDCDYLMGTIRIGKNVRSIGVGAFASCRELDAIEVSRENQYYASDDYGVMYNKEMRCLEQAPGYLTTKFQIPASVRGIQDYAFADIRFVNFEIPNGISIIGEWAFSGCRYLKTVTIAPSVTAIENRAFDSCGALQEIRFLGDAPVFEIGNWYSKYTFYNVRATAYYPAGNETWTDEVRQNYGGTITWTPYDVEVAELKIVSQPVDFMGKVGDNATFTVTAEGNGLTYRWEYSADGGKNWQNAGSATNKLNVEFRSDSLQYQFRCVITDTYGSSVTTDVVMLVLADVNIIIQTQPVSYVGAVNDELSFTVEAMGDGLRYQWYFSTDGGKTWGKSGSPGNTTATLNPILRAYRDGYQFYCQITDARGKQVTTNVVSMTVKASDIIITRQPVSVANAKVNELYEFGVEATGDNLVYRWELSTDGGKTWQDSWNGGYNTPNLSVRMYPNRDGNMYRCRITSGLKIVAYSDAVLLDMQDASVKLVSQDGNVFVTSGKTATFTVDAEGMDLSYAWYRSNDKGNSWVQTYLSGYNTNSLSFVANAGRAAMYMCKITDGSGAVVWSSPVKLQILSAELKILTQPVSMTCANGGTAIFSVAAQGDTLKYQWYSSSDGVSWTASYLTGYDTPNFSFTVNSSRAAKLYKCVITDVAGNTVETRAVSVTIK